MGFGVVSLSLGTPFFPFADRLSGDAQHRAEPFLCQTALSAQPTDGYRNIMLHTDHLSMCIFRRSSVSIIPHRAGNCNQANDSPIQPLVESAKKYQNRPLRPPWVRPEEL